MSHNVKSGHSFVFETLQVLSVYTTASGLGFLWIPKYANMYVSASRCLPCAFSCLVVLLCSDFFPYFMVFYY